MSLKLNARDLMAKAQADLERLETITNRINEITGKEVDTEEVKMLLIAERERHKAEVERLKKMMSKRANRTDEEKEELHQLRLDAQEIRTRLKPWFPELETERGRKIRESKARKRAAKGRENFATA